MIETGNKRVIVSSTVEFKNDAMAILKVAEENGGWITFSNLKQHVPEFNSRERFVSAIDQLLLEGLGWEDEQPLMNSQSRTGVYATDKDDFGLVYWFPSIMKSDA